jgi:two-component system OmpR family response regulator
MADPTDRASPEGGGRGRGQGVILHVEDEEPNRALLRAAFSRSDVVIVREATLLEAPDLETARRLLDGASIDVLLLDVRLPDGNGLDLARALRDGQSKRRPSVIVMSASVLPSERETALTAGADHFLAKPYVPSELVRLVADELRSGTR